MSTATATTTVAPVPDLPGFAEFLGVRIAVIGDDADFMVALGHHDSLLRTLAAFRRCHRYVCEDELCPTYGRQATIAHLAEEHLRVAWAEVEPRPDVDWWMSWFDDPAPGRFPVTVFDNLDVCGG